MMEDLLNLTAAAFKESLSVTLLVLLVMSLVELINITKIRKWFLVVKNRPFLEVFLSCFLGAIPGCAGGFAVVSLYSQGFLSFGALLGGMIATFGDEALFLFAEDPKTAIILTFFLFFLGLIAGILVNTFSSRRSLSLTINNSVDETNTYPDKKLSERIILFLKDNVWKHVIKSHALKIFGYIFFTLMAINVANLYFNINDLLQSNTKILWIMLLLAAMIGIIPVSGPHLIFVVLYTQGAIPFAILASNSISQNGHAGLPLLTTSKRDFLYVKAITLILAIAIGGGLLII